MSKYKYLDPRTLTVFITGATAGFGRATAIKFLEGGARVIGTGRREERLQEMQKELGPRFHAINADVGDAAAMKTAVESLPSDFQNVDVLVNNAGFAAGLELAPESKLEDWHAMIDTNVKGVVTTTKLLLPGMVERDRGHIVMLGSVASSYPYPGGNVYGASKAFVSQFALNLRADLLGKNIRVTNLEPGMCETEFSVVRFKGDEAKAKKVYEGMQPLTPEDLAEVIWWTTTLPPHVNVNSLELMPVMQAFSPFAVARKT